MRQMRTGEIVSDDGVNANSEILTRSDVEAAIAAAESIGSVDHVLEIADTHRLRVLMDLWSKKALDKGIDALDDKTWEEVRHRVDNLIDADLVVRAALMSRTRPTPLNDVVPDTIWDMFVNSGREDRPPVVVSFLDHVSGKVRGRSWEISQRWSNRPRLTTSVRATLLGDTQYGVVEPDQEVEMYIGAAGETCSIPLHALLLERQRFVRIFSPHSGLTFRVRSPFDTALGDRTLCFFLEGWEIVS